jgi:O-antigen/teichoic acid export membrane protein
MNIKTLVNYTIGPLGSGVIGVITLPLMTWFYTADDIGRITMIQVYSNFIISFFSLGLDQAYIRSYYITENKTRLFKNVIFPSIFIYIAFFILIIVANYNYIAKNLLGLEGFFVNFLIFFAGFFSLCIRFFSLIMRMEEKSLNFSISQIMTKISLLILIIVGVIFGFNNYNISLLALYVFSLFIGLIYSFYMSRKYILYSFSEEFSFIEFKSLLKYGAPLAIGVVSFWALSSIDRIIIKKFLTLEDLGVYAVTLSIASGVALFSGILNTIWAPLDFKWESEKNIDINKYNKILNFFLMALYFLVIFFITFSWLINLFLPKNYFLVEYLIILCIFSPIVYSLSEITGVGISLLKKTTLVMVSSVLALITNIILVYLTIDALAIKSIAISSAISFYIYFVLKTEFSRKYWVKLPIIKVYAISFFILLVSIWILIFEPSILYRIILGGCMFLLGFYFFYKEFNLLSKKINWNKL